MEECKTPIHILKHRWRNLPTGQSPHPRSATFQHLKRMPLGFCHSHNLENFLEKKWIFIRHIFWIDGNMDFKYLPVCTVPVPKFAFSPQKNALGPPKSKESCLFIHNTNLIIQICRLYESLARELIQKHKYRFFWKTKFKTKQKLWFPFQFKKLYFILLSFKQHISKNNCSVYELTWRGRRLAWRKREIFWEKKQKTPPPPQSKTLMRTLPSAKIETKTNTMEDLLPVICRPEKKKECRLGQKKKQKLFYKNKKIIGHVTFLSFICNTGGSGRCSKTVLKQR